jgi:thioredoxin-like negative regulator of GroEL
VAKVPARHNEAITQLKALNASNPGNADLQNTLARLLIADGRNEEALPFLSKWRKTTPGAMPQLPSGISRFRA